MGRLKKMMMAQTAMTMTRILKMGNSHQLPTATTVAEVVVEVGEAEDKTTSSRRRE